MPQRRRIYLDNAATSWPKPDAVVTAVERYLRDCGAPAGRSAYAEASQASHAVATTRAGIARLLGADDPRRIVFTHNGTDALNLAIHGVLAAGDHVVTTVVEHNSVLRPLRQREDAGLGVATRVPCDASGLVDPDAVVAALTSRTRLVVVSHASNVTGALQPVAEIGRRVRQHGALLLVDAAQTVGHMPIDVDELCADLLAAPGHKGLLGPLGTGMLYVRGGVEKRLATTRQGGTGTQSEDDHHPTALPYKYEAGSLNVAGIVGLGAGIDFLRIRGLDTIRRHQQRLCQRLLAGLWDIGGVVVHGPRELEQRVGVVSITMEGYDPQEAAATLDGAYRIQVRSGIQCAPLMHRALGTLEGGGTVRFSIGAHNTDADIDASVAAVAEMAAEAAVT